MLTLEFVKSNLFEIDNNEYTYAHCISADCAMGAGIAKTFTKVFPTMKNELRVFCRRYSISAPWTVLYEDKVFNLITKQFYYQKPTYVTLKRTLELMKDTAIENNIYKIAMPRIGCGLDGLQWTAVEDIIREVFDVDDYNFYIKVCSL